jgi:diaminohydroxyphosphoribosylaminopyrimidine deaminase/5-amino-6-(5-phosphoribosylamino)uracil reductase
VDDPLLTVRAVFRDRPLTRVVFDRRLRIRPDARLFSTLHAGPVIIVTSSASADASPAAVDALEHAGATVLPCDGGLGAAVRCLVPRGVQGLLLEGGATLHAAAWREGLVDAVQIYVSPDALGAGEGRLPDDRGFTTALLDDAHATPLGRDVLIEGYVHRPR